MNIHERMTREQIRALMLPQIKDIVKLWDSDGILIETQFGSLCQHTMTNNREDIYEIIVEHGGHPVDSDEPCALAENVPDEGFMYYLFDADRLSIKETKAIVRGYFHTC